MNKYYSDEKNIQILIALLKAHRIKYVVASPGNTNLTLVASLQQDSYFIIYSSVDERSAAYMACGLAAETGEAVMLSCTGATASRNYMSALTEAYYRKLPVLAVTSCRSNAEIGHLIPQVIDRRVLPNDIVRLSEQLPIVKDEQDEWECNIKVNRAILELYHRDGGPVHLNIPTTYCPTFNTKELPSQRIINRLYPHDNMPNLDGKRIAILVGSHKKWNNQLTQSVEKFCESYNSVVCCDHTSAYNGRYRIQYSLIGGQEQLTHSLNRIDVLIHIGEISGDYFSTIGKFNMSEVWRISQDGELCDTFHKLRYVFEMPEDQFFRYYTHINNNVVNTQYYDSCRLMYDHLYEIAKTKATMPFSNIWIAAQMAHRLPSYSYVHFSILSSLRSWNFFEFPQNIESFCNVGGFGIDGCVSSLIGASLAHKEKLHIGIIGDLAFFYDMNVLGNRHLSNNLRILLINNNIGAEFKLYCYPGAKLEDETTPYIAAEGHFGQKSPKLVRHYAQDLGFEYLDASSKEEFEQHAVRFLSPTNNDKPILLEVFTSYQDESKALEIIRNLDSNTMGFIKKKVKDNVNYNTIQKVRNILKN